MPRRLAPRSFRGLTRSLGTYLKYQVVAKLVTAAVAAPVLGLATAALVEAGGQPVVTQDTLVPFLLSWRGAAFALALSFVVLAGFVVELCGFITISSRAIHALPEARYRDVLLLGVRRSRNLLGLALPLVVAYLVLIVPLTGTGTTVGQLTNLKVPNFVMAAINDAPLLLAGYVAVIAALAVAGAGLAFTFHFMVIGDQRVSLAVANSIRLTSLNWRRYLRLVAELAVAVAIISVISMAWLTGVFLLVWNFGAESAGMRIVLIGLWLVQQSVVGLATFLVAPIQIHAITRTFYDCVAVDDRFAALRDAPPELPARQGSTPLDRVLGRLWGVLALWLALVVALAIPGGLMVEALLKTHEEIHVVGHRAGGFGTPENSLAGLRFAIDQGAWGVEVDVQRTKDGHYVLNHDATFRRAAGVRRAAEDMTLAEVRQLDLDPGPAEERVPTLEEFLRAAKGRTKVFIELKGSGADRRMADDVVALVERLGMREEAVVISLKYDLVRHIERNTPAVDTGYLYFLSIGDVSNLDGDYLILEEGEATDSRLVDIADAGKRAIVWTVNEPESMRRFANKPVHALITDEVEQLRDVLELRGSGTDVALYLRLFLGPGF